MHIWNKLHPESAQIKAFACLHKLPLNSFWLRLLYMVNHLKTPLLSLSGNWDFFTRQQETCWHIWGPLWFQCCAGLVSPVLFCRCSLQMPGLKKKKTLVLSLLSLLKEKLDFFKETCDCSGDSSSWQESRNVYFLKSWTFPLRHLVHVFPEYLGHSEKILKIRDFKNKVLKLMRINV